MIFENIIISILLSFFTAFVVSHASIPSIIGVARMKQLFDEPGERTSHKYKTPTLGGLAIFAGLLVGVSLWCNSYQFVDFQYIIGALVVMFFIGLKDDILIIAPWTKMSGQIIAASIVTILGDIRISSLHGFYGVTEIPYIISVLLTIFLIITVINGFNLIDGINGLSSGVGIVCAITFGTWFYFAEEYQYAIFSAALIGALLAFFRFNVFSEKNKIFMGDTGSLILGLVISILAIRFNECNKSNLTPYFVHAAPGVSFGILVVPFFDTLRIMFIRIVLRKPLFKPDRNHIHHRLLDLGLSHGKATLSIISVNVLMIGFVFYFQQFEILRLFLIIILLGMFFSSIPVFLIERKEKREKKLKSKGNKKLQLVPKTKKQK